MWKPRCPHESGRVLPYWNSEPFWYALESWSSWRATPPWSDPTTSLSSPPCPSVVTALHETPSFPLLISATLPIGFMTFFMVSLSLSLFLLVAGKWREKKKMKISKGCLFDKGYVVFRENRFWKIIWYFFFLPRSQLNLEA